jgi:hypothetical protein
MSPSTQSSRRVGVTAGIFLAAALSAALVGLGCARPAAAGTAAPTSIAILTPANSSRVLGTRLVARVRVRGPRFRATLDGRDVTARFGRPRHGVRSATFRRGHGFHAGRMALRVEVGKPSTRSYKTVAAVFQAAVLANRRMHVHRMPWGGGRSPLQLAMRTSARIASVRMWVNGKRVRSGLPLESDAKGLIAKLGAFDHVRFGRNKVLADVEYRDGKVSRTTGIFTVTRTRPLAGAGPDRTIAAGRRVVLDGSSSRAAHPGDRLSFRWQVVSAPKGSRVRIGSVRSVRTGFTARKPGRYRLRLVVSERRRARRPIPVVGRGATAASRAAQPATRAADEALIDVIPTANPMGVQVHTRLANGDNIQVGPTTYTCPAFTWVHVVVLNAKDLTQADGGNQCFTQNQTAQLLNAVNVTTHPNLPNDLVIANGLGLNPAAQTQWAPVLTTFFNAIGGTTSTTGSTLAGGQMPFVQDDWSLIGHVGLSPGEASQNVAGTEDSGSAAQAGAMNGYLQTVTTAGYQFVSPEFATLDTHASASTATQNVIAVGPSLDGPGGTYDSSPLPGGRSEGFQLLELASGTLQPISNATFVTRNANGGVNDAQIQALAQRLSYLAGDNYSGPEANDNAKPPLVILQSFGNASNSGLRAVGNDNAWVNDTLPSVGLSRGPYDEGRYDYFKWCGGAAATQSLNGYSCQPFPNNPTGLGSNATVTQAIGEIAGMSARTAAANFGLNGAPESLSLVGSPHPYSNDDVSFEIGADAQRTVATLRRTNQAQWRAAAPSPVRNFDASAMWQLAFKSPTPWPCSVQQPEPCSQQSAPTAAANAYIANKLWPQAGYASARQAYVPHISDSWTSNIHALNNDLPYPGPQAGFSQSVFNALKVQLGNEFSMISSVDTMFDNYEKVFATTASNGALLDMQTIGGKIMSAAFADNAAYQAQQVEVSQKDVTGDVLYLASDVLDLATFGRSAAVIGVAAGAYDLYQDFTEPDDYQNTGQVPFDEPDRIRDQADLVGTDLLNGYQGLNDTLDHLRLIFVNDWGKLQAAYADANGDWSLDAGSTAYQDLVQTSAMGAEAAFYNALMPVAYNEWFVSPNYTFTSSNQGNEFGNGEFYGGGLAMSQPGPNGYACQPGPQPFAGAPPSSLDWVRYTATHSASDDVGNGFGLSAVGRALKSRADPLTLQTATWNNNPTETDLFPATRNAGAAPLDAQGNSLTQKLFQAPTAYSSDIDPNGLDMNKDEFFGMSSWTTPRLQCGRPWFLGPTAP